MLIMNCFLFICFMNLCKSFSTSNLFSTSNSFNLINKNSVLNDYSIGDYYIDKDLHILDYTDSLLSYINLHKEKKYYCFYSILDEDDDGYDTDFTQYKKEVLEPSMKPIVIYSNKKFHKLSFENKYKQIVEDKLKLSNKSLNDVSKIINVEHRYEKYF